MNGKKGQKGNGSGGKIQGIVWGVGSIVRTSHGGDGRCLRIMCITPYLNTNLKLSYIPLPTPTPLPLPLFSLSHDHLNGLCFTPAAWAVAPAWPAMVRLSACLVLSIHCKLRTSFWRPKLNRNTKRMATRVIRKGSSMLMANQRFARENNGKGLKSH